MAKIILTTIGSLGDLHPFIAIGKALVARGDQVVLAVPEDGVAKVRAAGLEAASILPSYDDVCARMGLSPEEAAAKVVDDVNFVVEKVLVPYLDTITRALDDIAADADVIAGSIFAFSSEIVAEKRGLPYAAILLQPMTLFSAWQPPMAPGFRMMRHAPRTGIGRGWNRTLTALGRFVLRRRYAATIDAIRAEHGLAPSRGAPMLDYDTTTAAVVCCWSPVLGQLPPDAPANTLLAGFPLFDSESGAEEVMAPELRAFLDAGDPPIVFTLGSIAVVSPGRFYEEAAAAARSLGKRALMLTAQPGAPRRDGDCLFMGYAPHSSVFPRAAAVVHHGGIGTTGQAVHAGRPQIVVPHFGDQFDNAARVQRAGLGVTIRREKFDRAHAARVIGRILSDPAILQTAQRAAATVAGEHGAVAAAEHIATLRSS